MVFHPLKCIFVHPPSTGGTSVEFSLANFICENNNIKLYSFATWMAIQYGKHKTLYELKKLVNEKVWSQYFKFMFVRNPWDRFVSFYHRRMIEDKNTVSFFEFVRLPEQFRFLKPQTTWFHEDLDFVGRFENLVEDFDNLCKIIGADVKKLAHLRYGKERQLPHYSCYYDDEAKKIVADAYREDIDRFGYVFEGRPPEKLGDESESTT